MFKIDARAQFEKKKLEFRRTLLENGEVIKMACRAIGIHVYMVDYVNRKITMETKWDPNSTVEKYQWDIDGASTVANYVLKSGKVVLTNQVIGDDRFPEGIPWRPRARSVLCLPVIAQSKSCLGIYEMFREDKNDPFTEDDLEAANVILGWMGASLSQSPLDDDSLESKQRLLKVHEEVMEVVAESIKGTNLSEDNMICPLLMKLKRSMNADYIYFFEIDINLNKTKESYSSILYDDGVTICGDRFITKKTSTFRFTEELGTAWHAAETRKPINLHQPITDSRFSSKADLFYGFKTQSILTYPVISQNLVLGSVSVVNKVNGPSFSENDEKICSIYASCLALLSHYNRKQARLRRMISKREMTKKLLLQKLMPNERKIERLITSLENLQPQSDFFSFLWYPMEYKEMSRLAVYMLRDTLDPVLAANTLLLVGFVLTVQRSYRWMMYHNFEHAITVMHCAYIILKRNQDTFDQIEKTAIMLAAICHDSDHPGLTNSFLVTTNHPLSKLYDCSPLESHHNYLAATFIQEMGILNHLPSSEYAMVMSEINNNILATDLASFFEKRMTVVRLQTRKQFTLNIKRHRTLMKCILMTSCDLSFVCKQFDLVKRKTEMLYEEFYRQGDQEKKLGFTPAIPMNRDLQSRIPEEQVNFYTVVALPCFSLLTTLIINTKPLYDSCLENHRLWGNEMQRKNQPMWRVEDSYDPEVD